MEIHNFIRHSKTAVESTQIKVCTFLSSQKWLLLLVN